MRKLLYLLLFIVITTAASAQQGNMVLRQFNGAPTGGCATIQFAIDLTTGDFYDCFLGAWLKVNGGGGGSGTVTQINTTAPISGGPITTTGTLTCPTCVVATAPGAGIAHFAGGTQTVTSSPVSLTADVSGLLPLGNQASPTGTGFEHVTAGIIDGTAKTVDVSSADTTGVLKAASFPALTGDITTVAGALATTLATVATPATGLKTTVNAKGLVTAVTTAACADLSNAAASCATDATNAANISAGTLLAGRMPALTGDVTSTVNTVATTIATGAVSRAKLAADGKNWSFLGSATGATTTVGPIVWTTACREYEFHYIVKGYNGGTPIGRFLTGVASISTTALTNGSNLSQNFAAPTSAPSIPGIPLATATTNIPREGWIHVYGASGDLKSINIQGQEGSLAVASPPAIFIAAGAFSDLSTNLPLLRAQLTVYDTLIAVAASAQTFNAGTTLEGWCRNGD